MWYTKREQCESGQRTGSRTVRDRSAPASDHPSQSYVEPVSEQLTLRGFREFQVSHRRMLHCTSVISSSPFSYHFHAVCHAPTLQARPSIPGLREEEASTRPRMASRVRMSDAREGESPYSSGSSSRKERAMRLAASLRRYRPPFGTGSAAPYESYSFGRFHSDDCAGGGTEDSVHWIWLRIVRTEPSG